MVSEQKMSLAHNQVGQFRVFQGSHINRRKEHIGRKAEIELFA